VRGLACVGGLRRATASAITLVALLAGGAAVAGCGGDPRPVQAPVSSPVVTPSGPRVAAGTFPVVDGYTWKQVPDDEWAQLWPALSASFHGLLADGQGRYVLDRQGNPVGMVVVAWPPPAKAGAAAMKAAMDEQSQQAAAHFGTAGVRQVAGHDVLEFTDGYRQPNWYWVSGDEFVLVTGHEYAPGAAFVSGLSASTR
jgi:hypothetical protein